MSATILKLRKAFFATIWLYMVSLGCDTARKEAATTGVTQTLPRARVPMTYYVDVIGPVTNPLTKPSIEVPSKELLVSGWVIDDSRKAAAGGADVVIDHIPYAARYRISRKDVAAYFKEPAYENSGFDFTIPVRQMTKGTHVFAIRVVASDSKSYWESPEFTLVVR